MRATTWSGSNVLSLSVASCNASPTVDIVDETAEKVRVEVEADSTGVNGDDCEDVLTACLDKPLGERALIDNMSGDVVVVEVRNSGSAPACATA